MSTLDDNLNAANASYVNLDAIARACNDEVTKIEHELAEQKEKLTTASAAVVAARLAVEDANASRATFLAYYKELSEPTDADYDEDSRLYTLCNSANSAAARFVQEEKRHTAALSTTRARLEDAVEKRRVADDDALAALHRCTAAAAALERAQAEERAAAAAAADARRAAAVLKADAQRRCDVASFLAKDGECLSVKFDETGALVPAPPKSNVKAASSAVVLDDDDDDEPAQPAAAVADAAAIDAAVLACQGANLADLAAAAVKANCGQFDIDKLGHVLCASCNMDAVSDSRKHNKETAHVQRTAAIVALVQAARKAKTLEAAAKCLWSDAEYAQAVVDKSKDPKLALIGYCSCCGEAAPMTPTHLKKCKVYVTVAVIFSCAVYKHTSLCLAANVAPMSLPVHDAHAADDDDDDDHDVAVHMPLMSDAEDDDDDDEFVHVSKRQRRLELASLKQMGERLQKVEAEVVRLAKIDAERAVAKELDERTRSAYL